MGAKVQADIAAVPPLIRRALRIARRRILAVSCRPSEDVFRRVSPQTPIPPTQAAIANPRHLRQSCCLAN